MYPGKGRFYNASNYNTSGSRHGYMGLSSLIYPIVISKLVNEPLRYLLTLDGISKHWLRVYGCLFMSISRTS